MAGFVILWLVGMLFCGLLVTVDPYKRFRNNFMIWGNDEDLTPIVYLTHQLFLLLLASIVLSAYCNFWIGSFAICLMVVPSHFLICDALGLYADKFRR